MKKQLLTLSLLLMSVGLFSQTSTIWSPRNINVDTLWGVRYLWAVDSNTMWATVFDGSHAAAVSNRFTRTQDGTNFTAGTFMPASDTNNFNASNITAVNDSTAWITVYDVPADGRSGRIFKTVDRGLTWSLASDTNTMFTGASNFPDWTHFWNANRGITLGDPNNGNVFEVYHTYDGGATWSQLPASAFTPSVTPNGEYGVTDVFTTYGAKHIWFGTIHSANATNHIYRSSDTGHTWKSSVVPGFQGGVTGIAFRDSLNGLAWGATATSSGKFIMKKTNDGGITWSSVWERDMVGEHDICAVPGRNAYMSVGIDSTSIAAGGIVGNGILTSVSYDDGNTWTVLEGAPGGPGANVYRMLQVQMLDSAHGWAGTFSDNQLPLGTNGADKYRGPVIPKSCPLNVVGTNTVCSGNSVTLTANGTAGATYTWTPGGANTTTVSVNPTSNQVYTVNSVYSGCTNTQTFSLTVKATPTVSASAATPTICALNSTQITATGANTYQWSPGTGLSSTTSGTVTGTYSTAGTYTYNVTGTSNGCNAVASVTITVLPCVGIAENSSVLASIFPNPSHGAITIDFGKAAAGTKVIISDMIGNQVYQNNVNAGTDKVNVDLSTMPKGIYLVTVTNAQGGKSVHKMIVE